MQERAACAVTPPPQRVAPASAPNIALVLTDDLDKTLGGETSITATRRLLGEGGTIARNWFVHTPVCCPSRAQLLTGRYFHNLRNRLPTDKGCMHINVTASQRDSFYSEHYFAPHLQRAGYTVGLFGKHLNNANLACPPPGVDRWFANGGGDYFAPTFSVASAGDERPHTERWTNCTYSSNRSCYSTSVIGNVSLAWMRAVLAEGLKPLFAYIAVKAPHIQDGPGWPIALAAPWHSSAFEGIGAPRTPNWNASCPGHHWMIRTQPPLTSEQAARSDALYRSRWQAMLSVDDLVVELARTLDTDIRPSYIVFTSDHGYRFGQFRMPQGKWNVYDTDLRVPFFVRGPGVIPNSTFGALGSNVDTMPTILGLAGVPTPSTMDGRSAVANFLARPSEAPTATAAAAAAQRSRGAWRSDLLIEYYGLGKVVRYEHLEDTQNNTYRALRRVEPAAAVGERNLKFAEFTSWSNWDFETAADEYELFDLDADPWETTNLYPTLKGSRLAKDLAASLAKLYRCSGASCN